MSEPADPFLRLLGTRENIAELEAIDTTILRDGAMVFVADVGVIYALLKESTETPDGETIVAPLDSAGRWFLQTSEADVDGFLITETDWYVDPVNGDDTNDGLTPATAFKTYQYGVSPRFNGGRFPAPVTGLFTRIHQLGSVPADDVYWARTSVAGSGPQQLVFQAEATDIFYTPPGPITAATSAAVNVRGQFTIAGANFTGMEGKRVRIISGTDVGATGWIQRVISPTSVFVSQGYVYETDSFTAQFRVGDTIVVEDLYRGPAITGYNTTTRYDFNQIQLKGLHFEGTDLVMRFAATSIYQCKIVVKLLQCNTLVYVFGCYVEAPLVQSSEYLNYENCLLRVASMLADLVEISRSDQLVGLTLLAGRCITRNYFHMWDWSTADLAAVTVEPGATLDAGQGRLTGTSANANTYGIRVRSSGKVYYQNNANKPNVAGAAAFNVDVGGTQVLYAAVPASTVNTTNLSILQIKAPL